MSDVADDNKNDYEDGGQAESNVVTEDEAIEARLKNLVGHHARERAEMAEKISQLQEENEFLKKCLNNLDSMCDSEKKAYDQAVLEKKLGLDFSLPEDQ